MSKTHDLKLHTAYYSSARHGRKTWELRVNDRDYRVGDILHLREWFPSTGDYSGLSFKAEVLGVWEPDPHILIPDGYVLMSIRVVEGDGNAAHHG